MKTPNLIKKLLNLYLAIVEGILGLRFLLKLFGANANTGFVAWVYEMSDSLLEPFRAIFPTRVYENKYVLEFSTLFAMLIYALLVMLLVYIVDLLASAATSKKPAEESKVEENSNQTVKRQTKR